MKKLIYTLLKTALFWLTFFMVHRLLFILFNPSFAADVPWSALLASFGIGLRLDGSFTGYLLLLAVVLQLPALAIARRFCLKCIHGLNLVLIPLFVILLLGDINLYRYWGSHLNIEAISFLKTPGIVMASLHWLEVVLFFVAWILVSLFFVWMYQLVVISRPKKRPESRFGSKQLIMNILLTLLVAALTFIPIRGSFGVAPINTGAAYFSRHLFANHAAVNPLWNLAYSMKRVDARSQAYHFMPDKQAQAIFRDMMRESDKAPKILNRHRPNIVVILLESFSAQVIAPLGGADVTPHFNALLKEGVFFSNFFASSVRSDKGLVGVLAGYPVMPLYSIMQYPAMSQSLEFLPKHLRQAGYRDFNYLYGGDIGFKSMNSFVTLAGFDHTITIDDFPSKYQGKKWGVHDEYTFDKLIELMKKSEAPWFNFFFTLSSHEPFDVPMETIYEDKYYNSVHYTDRCLGQFFKQVKKDGLWDNTLFILVADHGVVGPENAQFTDRKRFNIPMLWTGGALAVKDTVVTTYGGQTDIAATLLNQLDLNASSFTFSKNILDEGLDGFAFFDYPDAFGIINQNMHQVFDNQSNRFIKFEGKATQTDSLKAKAYMQMVSGDHKKR